MRSWVSAAPNPEPETHLQLCCRCLQIQTVEHSFSRRQGIVALARHAPVFMLYDLLLIHDELEALPVPEDLHSKH